MLDVLAVSPYWNWFDTRLLQALVSASGSAEAEALLQNFKRVHYARKVCEILPYVSVVPLKESITFTEKFDKDSHELTLLDIIKHKHQLEYEVLDIGEKKIILSCIKTGCVELTWQVPQELVYRAYTSMKRKHDELSSLAVKSLVCEVVDPYAGLPYLWHGQEVGEVGPFEPLPEYVRQEPYSLPQGFQWVALSSSDVKEMVKLGSKLIHTTSAYLLFFMKHPHTRSEWQFGIRASNGKLIGVVLAYPVCMRIGGVLVKCVFPTIFSCSKYWKNRLCYMLLKELQRRIALSKINQFVISIPKHLIKPVTTVTMWKYNFTSDQLPTFPRIPNWRKMTSKDIPSTLSLVNNYSLQFEIRQIFTSEEEFFHHFLHPNCLTYVVENKNRITDFVSFSLYDCVASINMVVSTHVPVNELLIDAIACAREKGATAIKILQSNLLNDTLLSLSFQEEVTMCYCIYNYKYYEIPQCKFWYKFH